MTDVLAGTAAPAVPAPGAQPVTAPEVPTSPDQATPQGEESVKPPRTYTEDEHRQGISNRLKKEQRRMERTIRAEVERDYLRQQVESGRQQREEPSQPKKGAPKPEDYGNDYEGYLIAKAKHALREDMDKERETSERETAQQRDARQNEEQAQAVQSRFNVAREKHEDFDEVVLNERASFTRPMAAFFGDSERGGDLAYHLGQNLDELKRISALSPASQFRELVKLEASISAPPKPTQVPPPIVPGGGSAGVKKEWKDMTTEEHVKAYHKRKR